MDKISIAFVVRAFVISFASVSLYSVVANVLIYMLIKKEKRNEMFIFLRKRAFLKLPFLLTTYGFLTGLAVYFALSVIDVLVGRSGGANIPSGGPQPSGSEMALVVFTLFGFCVGVVVGWAAFFKLYKSVNSSADTKTEAAG